MYINSKTWINGFWSNERGKRRGTAPRRALDGLHVRGYDNHILSNRDTHNTNIQHRHTHSHTYRQKKRVVAKQMSWLLAEGTIKATCSMASPSPVLNVTKNLGLDKYLTHLHWLQLEI